MSTSITIPHDEQIVIEVDHNPNQYDLISIEEPSNVVQVIHPVTEILQIEVPGIQGGKGNAGAPGGDPDLPDLSLIFENHLL